MTIVLPLLALVLAVIGFVLGRVGEVGERPPAARGIAALLVAMLAVLAAHRFADAGVKFTVSIGVTLGTITSLVAAYLPRKSRAEPLYLALGVFGVAVLLWRWPDQIRWSALAYIAGLGFAALAMGDELASLTAVAGSLVAAVTVMGRYGSDTPSYTHAGVALGLGLCVIGIVRQALLTLKTNFNLQTAVTVRVLGVGLAFAIGSRYLGLHDAWIAMALAVAAGTAVWAATPSDDITEPGRSVVASVIWVGLGTLAFGLARGYGMSLALLLAAGIHLVLGERRALTTCGPLLGLVFYRIFHDAHVDASRALDLGQHYAIIGLLFGAALPLLPDRWWAIKPVRPILQGVGGVLWAVLWAGAPFLAALLLGPKGLVGFVAGVGLSSLFSATGGVPSLLPLAAAAAVGGISAVSYGWLQDLTNLTRDEKLHWVLIGVIPLAIVGFVLSMLGFKKDSKTVVTTGAL